MLNFYGSFFALIFAVLLAGTNFYMRSEYLTVYSYLQYKVQLPTSDSTEITAGGIKVRLEGKYILYLTRVALVVSEILWGPKITLGGPAPPGRPSRKKLYPYRLLHNI